MDNTQLQHILTVSRQMAQTRDLPRVLNCAITEAMKLVGAERGYLVLLNDDGSLDFRVKCDQAGQELTDVEDQISRSILREVVETAQPLVLRDAMRNKQFSQAESVMILGLRSIMCVPLVKPDEVIGAIYVENRSIRGRFSEEDASPLVIFANQAAVAIENAQLFTDLQEGHDQLEVRVQERTIELQQANGALQEKNVQLQDALDTVKTLRGLLPICAGCKKIRDDDGYWHQVEEYVSAHTEAGFSHGLCPNCAHTLYPELYSDKEKGKE